MPELPLIAGLGGSLREKSYSRAALRAIEPLVKARGYSFDLLDLRELNLPMFVADQPVESYSEAEQRNIRRLIDSCRRANAMIWASPTYHGTVSGALKNALDFMELLLDDQPPYLQGRPVGLIAVSSPTPFGAMMNSAQELRAWLAPTQVMLNQEAFTPTMALQSERIQRLLARLVDELVTFTQIRAQRATSA